MWSSSLGRDRSPPPPYSPIPNRYQKANRETTPLLGRRTPKPPRYSSRKRSASDSDKSAGRACNGFGAILLAVLAIVALTAVVIPLVFLIKSITEPQPAPSYSIAIIGAGPAGIAAAQHLLRSTPGRQGRFNITIFESKPVVGGALAFHDSEGSPVYPKDDPMQSPITAEDVTGTALMWGNTLFTRDSERLLGDKVHFAKLGSEKIGYYHGTHRVATLRRPYNQIPFIEWLTIMWNYGASAWRAESIMNAGRKIREAMLKAPVGPDAESLFEALGVLRYVQISSSTGLKSAGISDHYATDIFEPQVRRLFAQGAKQVSGLALLLAATQENEADRYMGGNMIDRLQRIVENMNVDVRTSTRVNAVKHVLVAEGKYSWLVQCEDAEKDSNGEPSVHIEAFDKVIVAAHDRKMRFETSEGRMRSLIADYGMDEEYEGIDDLGVVDDDDDVEAEARPWPRDFPFIPAHVAFFTSEKKLWGDNQVLLRDEEKGKREFALVRELFIYQDDGYTKTEYLYRALSHTPVLDELLGKYPITWSYQTRIENGFALSRPLSGMPWFDCPWADDLWWTSVIQYAWNGVDLNWLAGKIVAEELTQKVMKEEK